VSNSIRIEGIGKLFRKLDAIGGAFHNKKVLMKMAALASSEIKAHTLAGQDEHGKAFKPYSRGYLAGMRKKGRKLSNKVNLFDSGDMFRSITWKMKSKRSAVVFLRSAEQAIKASAHHFGGGNLPRRPWFGLQKGEQKKLTDVLRSEIQRVLHGP